jgi:2-dehydro-3-deoxygalactonokinase
MASALPMLISVDWGTTSLRCALVSGDGAVLDLKKTERGILKTDGRSFEAVLGGQITDWLPRFAGGTAVPVIMSGMIGSRQGWREAAYLGCPASPQSLAENLLRIDTSGTALGSCDIRIVPGMDISGQDELGNLPDVMRGEETQVFGALIAAGLSDGVFVLPGTHSKWVLVEGGKITEFRTFMTGEVYAALLEATILGRLAEDEMDDESGFALGVTTASHASSGGPGQLLNMVFTARSRVLHGELEEKAVRSYLSGLLIGAEILSGMDCRRNAFQVAHDDPVTLHIIGDGALQKRYIEAASLSNFELEPAVDNPVPIAHLAIARLAKIVS